jgi:hypothetical protein
VPNSLAGIDAGDPNAIDGGGGNLVDGGPDANVRDADPADADTSILCTDWTQTPTNYFPCAAPLVAPAIDLNAGGGTWRFDTDDGTLTSPAGASTTVGGLASQVTTGPQLWAIVVTDFTIQSDNVLEVTGSNPLAIISYNSIDVKGEIYVNSVTGGRTGPGANPTAPHCTGMKAAEDGEEAGGKGGGGGGGGLGEDGKKGGKGNDAAMTEGGGGKKENVFPLAVLRGGCPGGNGGVGDGTGGAGVGGSGGGAILLSARNDVTVSGLIQAGGAGGSSATANHSGGGGGGSGGYIALEAPLVTASNSTLAANGGGGGGGIETTVGSNGLDGQPGDITASGGSGPDAAGDGGRGGREGEAAANGQNAGEGGGGGGAGAGFVVIHAQEFVADVATVTPARDLNQSN